jgi:hypothetical protein
MNEWQKYIIDGGEIYSQDGTALNAGALFGKTPKQTRHVTEKTNKIVSQSQLRAINIMKGNHHG